MIERLSKGNKINVEEFAGKHSFWACALSDEDFFRRSGWVAKKYSLGLPISLQRLTPQKPGWASPQQAPPSPDEPKFQGAYNQRLWARTRIRHIELRSSKTRSRFP